METYEYKHCQRDIDYYESIPETHKDENGFVMCKPCEGEYSAPFYGTLYSEPPLELLYSDGTVDFGDMNEISECSAIYKAIGWKLAHNPPRWLS